MLLFWLLIFTLIHFQKGYAFLESMILFSVGLAMFLLLYFFENTYYALLLLLFTPFIFAHAFDAFSIPLGLYLGGILAFAGIIVHIIRFKPKIKLHKLFWTFALISVALVLGGNNYLSQGVFLQQVVFSVLVCAVLLFAFAFFTSTVKEMPFERIIFLLCIFGVFIQVQAYLAMFISCDFNFELMSARNISVGWGITNNIDLMLLFTLPAPLYYIYYFNYTKKALVIFPFICCLFYTSIALFMSRGSLMVATIFMITTYIALIVKLIKMKKYNNIFYFISSNIFFTNFILIFTLLIHNYVFLPDYFVFYLSQISFSTLNNRVYIYRDIFMNLGGNVLFGKGLFAGFFEHVDVGAGAFQWAHSTLIQSLYSCGLIGLICILAHLFYKYYYLLKKPNVDKIFLIAIFLLPGLYGLFDISYYFINFMIVLIVLLVLTTNIYDSADVIETINSPKKILLKKGVQ